MAQKLVTALVPDWLKAMPLENLDQLLCSERGKLRAHLGQLAITVSVMISESSGIGSPLSRNTLR